MPIINYEIVVPYRYIPDPRPCLAVLVIGPRGQSDIVAQVDSGSRYVIFDGRIAETIGLNLASGEYKELGTQAGGVPSRLHDVTLEVEGYIFACRAAFTEVPIRRSLLGREGFFSLWQIGFRERVSEMYLSADPYASELTPPSVT